MLKKINTFLVAISLTLSMGFAQKKEIQTIESKENTRSEVIYEEGFENNGSNIPIGWSQEQVVGNSVWSVVAGSVGQPSTAQEGFYKARMQGTGGELGNKTKLITQSLDLSEVSNPILHFWHAQRAFVFMGSNVQDILRIFYKNSSSGEWIQIVEYTENVSVWTEWMVILPNPSDDYYLAFECEIGGAGNGVHLDDIKIKNLNEPEISISSSLAFGTVYNNLPFPGVNLAQLTVKNVGGEDLIINNYDPLESGITLQTQLPLTIGSLQSANLQFKYENSEAPVGPINGNIILESNDPVNPVFSVNYSVTVAKALIVNYLEKDQTWVETISGPPTGWTGPNVQKSNNTGACRISPPCLYYRMGTSGNEGYLETPYLFMGENPRISFWYRANDNISGIGSAIDPYYYSYRIRISKDNGENWTEVFNTTNTSNPITSSYVYAETDFLEGFANELCLVRFIFLRQNTSSAMFLFIDDITAGSLPAHELEALSITGNNRPTQFVESQYTITVKNNGTVTQSDYTVKFMKEGDILLGELPGVDIAYKEEKEFVFSWTPTSNETTYLWGEVDFEEDQFLYNNITENFEIVEVLTGSIIAVVVGEGTETFQNLPYILSNRKGITQTLYFPNELKTNGGEISQIIYNSTISTAKPNQPITIWIGETQEINLRDGWIPLTGLNQVFNGVLDIQNGEREVVVTLDVPYQYNGGTLVIYSYTHYVAMGSMYNLFYGVTDPNSARSRVYFLNEDNEINFETPPITGSGVSLLHTVPKTKLIFDMSETGSLSGFVFDEDEIGLEGAKVQFVGSQLFAITDSEGFYSFPYLTEGTYQVEVSKYGYFDVIESGIIIEQGENTTKNIELIQIPTYTLSGKVTSNDFPGGLINVELTFTGIVNYNATTDESGNYSIQVYGGLTSPLTYNVQAIKSGYTTHNSTVDVINTDVIHNIGMVEILNPVTNPVAAKTGNNVVITWTPPAGISKGFENYQIFRFEEGTPEGDGWLLLSNSAQGSSFTDTGWNNLEILSEYQWAVKVEYSGEYFSEARITNVLNNKYVPFTVNITTNGNDNPVGATVILTNQDGDENKIYTKTATGAEVLFTEIWKGIYDLTVSLNGYETYTQEDINVLTTSSTTANLIEIIDTPFGLKVEKDNCEAIFSWNNTPTKSFTGYMVYLNGEEVEFVTTTHYLFDYLETGNYTASVKAIYTSDESEIVTIDFSMYCIGTYKVTFNIKDENNIPVTGAIVTFDGTTLPGYEIEDVAPGIHTYTITKDGYLQTFGEVEIIDQDKTEEVILIKTYTIFFTVFDSETFNSIEDAVITFEGEVSTYIILNVAAGTYGFTVEKESYFTFSDEITVTNKDEFISVPLVFDDSSINISEVGGIKIYPNPTTGEFKVSGLKFNDRTLNRTLSEVEVFDVYGRSVLISPSFGGGRGEVDISHLPNGVYFVVIESFSGEKGVYKIVKTGK